MNTDLKAFFECRLKVIRNRKIIFLSIIFVSPAAVIIPIPMNQLGVILYSAIFISIFIGILAFFISVKEKTQLLGAFKATEDKVIVSIKPTIFHLKLFGLTVNKQTQFAIETANNKKYLFMAPQKEAPIIYEAIMEVRNQRIWA